MPDPEVSTLSTLTNVQNSLFVPNLGRFVNRRPEYQLTPVRADSTNSTDTDTLPPISSMPTVSSEEAVEEGTEASLSEGPTRARKYSISSQLDESHYAVLPHLFSVDEWREEDVKMLNDHVRHQLHSRRAKFKRNMRGFGKYVSKRTLTNALVVKRMLTFHSSWLCCDSLCNSDHDLRTCLGALHHR